jgi:hypothetical protein
MIIQRHYKLAPDTNSSGIYKEDKTQPPIGYIMKLSANDTYLWAHKPGAIWPCSQLSGKRLVVCVDDNGLCDISINGRDSDCDGNELDAITADHLPEDLRHLWPVWETKKQLQG